MSRTTALPGRMLPALGAIVTGVMLAVPYNYAGFTL